ncbi:MAG: thioesterase family protein [Clostridia bacterium]
MEVEIGIKSVLIAEVDGSNTAKNIQSGDLPVFATPSMIALAEKAACECIKPYLDSENTTVGTLINMRHVSATPIGMSVRCECVLSETDGKRLVFAISVYDKCGLIGEGTHERAVVNIKKFMAKTSEKREKISV